ncbi:hypothetical protein TNCV_2240611 [Trichonephila clavipes]|nr:hypothetical protein TNCV_2240611 [Trichonephila clavipes]
MQMQLLSRLEPVVRKRENLMPKEDLNNLMRMVNTEQKSLLMHVIKMPLDSNYERLSITNFDCRVQFKRPGHSAAGVAIDRKHNSHVVTPHKDIIYQQTSGLCIAIQDIGNMCAA